jgi:saccharopine dehydrogenase-like NADP-dependent oxidoreductase
MKKVLILGAGMVVKPIVTYLLEKDYLVTVATRTKSKAEAMIGDHPNGIALAWTVDDEATLDRLVREHDLTVSLLPYAYHLMVAKMCIRHKKNMVTTSYVKPEMKALDAQAKEAGIIILNELGLDPGIDHMSAMRIIDHVHEKGGKIEEFYSFCGALVAPEVEKNPFNYKFTWAPRGVVMASNNDGKYLRRGEVISVSPANLFKDPLQVEVEGVGLLEVYPNRDSLAYIELYGIPETETMFRGTFRYTKWCEVLDGIKKLNLLSYDEVKMQGLTLAELLAKQAGFDDINDLKTAVAEKVGGDNNGYVREALEWLGFFSDEILERSQDSPFNLTADLMIGKMMIGTTERDMVVLQHTFVADFDGNKEVIKSTMVDYGTQETDTSVARTVALPAACGVDMILQGQISAKGVHIPVIPEIYNPILDQLEEMDIRMEEEYGLAMEKNIA